ncbi:MAG: sulfate/molybdate ABC transporter ATP-binding protein [Hyphomicrobiales bacterium]|nr:sulfate/molybdate ABC transporter ATP-binding protein [Hyphomicrobiales bacterium]
MNIEVKNITKQFGAFAALKDVSLGIKSGELMALLGPSGSGKTTLLRIIAGLEWPDAGQVFFNGVDVMSMTVRSRNVGFVFQHYALFRHMTVFENVAFGLRVRKGPDRASEAQIKERVMKLLNLVHIGWLADRYPSQLSGGQRQRVALARALAIEPSVLLLDEPFGALDSKVRKDLRRWLRRLHDELHVTSILVTHDQEEALEVADRVVVMGDGRIEQVGTPAEIYDDPATAFVHEFIGESVMLPVKVEGGAVELNSHGLKLDARGAPEGPATFYARPDDFRIAELHAQHLRGRVTGVRRFGATRRLDVEIDGKNGPAHIETSFPAGFDPRVGDEIGLYPERYRVFAKPETGS